MSLPVNTSVGIGLASGLKRLPLMDTCIFRGHGPLLQDIDFTVGAGHASEKRNMTKWNLFSITALQ